MIRRLVGALLLVVAFPSVAAWPCMLGDYGITYILTVEEGCGRTADYGISCGGELGETITSIIRITPIYYDCLYA